MTGANPPELHSCDDGWCWIYRHRKTKSTGRDRCVLSRTIRSLLSALPDVRRNRSCIFSFKGFALVRALWQVHPRVLPKRLCTIGCILKQKKKKSSRFISFLSRLREWESLFAAGPRFTGTTRGGHGAWKHYNLPRYNHGMGRFCLELISSHSDLLFCALLACAIPFYVNENNLG